MEMPVPCCKCGEWVELNDTRESRLNRGDMLCRECYSNDYSVYEKIREINDIQSMLDNNDPVVDGNNMEPNHGFRYLAYDAANGEYEQFKTLKEAKDWLTENDGEGISEEAQNGQNWIAEIQYQSVVTKIEDRDDYCQCDLDNEDCSCGKEEWPYSDEFAWIGDHDYAKIDWEKSSNTAGNEDNIRIGKPNTTPPNKPTQPSE